MTRTKADAAANPRAGEIWRKKRGDGHMDVRKVSHREGNQVFWWPDHAQCPNVRCISLLPNFTRWCKKAEFLGGSDAD